MGGVWAKIEKVGKECMFVGKGVISLGKEILFIPSAAPSLSKGTSSSSSSSSWQPPAIPAVVALAAAVEAARAELPQDDGSADEDSDLLLSRSSSPKAEQERGKPGIRAM